MSGAGDLCRLARERGLFTPWDGAPALGALVVTGPDAGAHLQSQLTSDVLSLAPGASQPSASLNRTGALVVDLSVTRLPERGQPFPSYLLIVDRAHAARLADELVARVVTGDVIVDDLTRELDGWFIAGPAAPAVLAALADMPAAAQAWTIELPLTGDAGFLVLQPRGASTSPGTAIAAAAHANDLVDWPKTGDPEAATAWHWLRVEAGRLLAGIDYLPGTRALAQTGLDQQVVSLSKGCYLGQEVVARVRTYGSVPEAVRALVFAAGEEESPAIDAPGVPVHDADGNVIGAWASAGWSSLWQSPVALAYLDRAHRAPGTTLTVKLADGTLAPAQVRLSPLHAATGAAERARHLHERAVHRFGLGDDQGAIDLLQQALRQDPSLGEAAEALGVILGRHGRYHEAIDIFKQLEETAPNEPLIHTNLSLFYMKLGDKAEAERQREQATLKRFANLDDDRTAAERAAAEAATRRADADRKLAMFSEVLAIDPLDGLALMGAANALAALERPGEAEPLYARARDAQPANSAVYLAHGRVLEILGRSPEAAETYRAGVAVASRKGDLQPLREMEHRLLMITAEGAARG